MKFTVLTLFPEIFDLYLSQTIIQRAVDMGIVDYEIINIREFSGNKHGQVDDTPFGGGAGMVLKPEPYWNYFRMRSEENPKKPFVIFVTPQGVPVSQNIIGDIAEKEEYLGDILDILETAAHDILVVVNSESREILIPMVDIFVKKIDFEAGKIEVELIEGMKE